MPDDLNSVVSSAVAEATTEVSGGEESTPSAPEPDKPAAPEPAAPAPKTAEKSSAAKVEKPEPAPEADEEVFTPTAEELDLINKSPELKKVYRSMQRGLTQKAQSIAAMRKEMEQKSQVVDWIQADPEKAIRAIATAAGVSLGEARQATESKVADSLEEKWAQVMGADAAAMLRPLFEDTARQILEQEVAPYRQQTEVLARQATERTIAASVREFGAAVSSRGEEWDDETQAEMAVLAKKIEPGENTPINEYLDVLYDKVVANRMRTKQARQNLERLRKVREDAEPATTTRPSPAAEERVTTDMTDKDAVAVAVRLAKQGLGIR